MAFIFGGNTGKTYAQIKREQEIADALLARSVSRAPRDIGEGLTAIGQAIAGKVRERRANREEREGRAKAGEQFSAVMEALNAPVSEPPAGMTPQGGGNVEVASLGAPGGAPGVSKRPDGTFAVDDAMWGRLVQQESGGDPNAVSPKGATGLAQIMPPTARNPGYGVGSIFDVARTMGREVPDESDATLNALMRDPQVNEAFGRLYFNAMLNEHGGDPRLAAAAYNAGPGAVQKAGGIPNFAETQAYVAAVVGGGGGQAVSAMNAPQGQQAAPVAAQGGVSREMLPLLMQAAGNDFLTPQQQQVVQALLQRELAVPEQMTPYQREQLKLQQARLQAQLSGRLATQPTINVNNAPENNINRMGDEKWAEVNASEAAKMFTTLAEDGLKAQGELAAIGELERLLESGVGGTADVWKAWAQNNLGVNVGAGGQVEAFNALINQLVPQQRPPGSGQMSDRDVQLFKESLPQLINSTQGNQLITTTMRAMAEHKRAQGEIVREALVGRMSREQALERLYSLPDPMEAFREQRKAILAGDGGGAAPAAEVPEGIDPADWEFMTPEERALWQN